MASGKYEPGQTTLFASSEIKQAAHYRTGVQDEPLDLSQWGLHLQPGMALGDMHRILAGMR